jgi:serine/threonine protein phosphatase PrpC
MTLALHYALRSDVGLLREGNEDSAYAGPHLLAIADGMGGHAAGEVASAVAISAIAPLDKQGLQDSEAMLGALAAAVAKANTTLHEMSVADPSVEGMGTTLTALLWAGAEVAVCHIGDSRAYLLRDGDLYQITRDHTLIQSLVDEGRLTPEAAANHPQRSLIMRALQSSTEAEPDLSMHEAALGDRYLLCSDGLTDVVTDQSLHTTLVNVADPDKAVRDLIDQAIANGGPDNITCIVADVVDTGTGPVSDASVLAGAAAANGDGKPRTRPTSNTIVRGRHKSNGTVTLVGKPDGAGADGQSADGEGGQDQDEDAPEASRRRWPLVTTVLVVLVLLVIGGGYWGWRITQSQYYVATDGSQVTIYRGINESVAGLKLSHVFRHTGIPVAHVTTTDRQDLPTSPGSFAAAEQTVQNIKRHYTCQVANVAVAKWTTTRAGLLAQQRAANSKNKNKKKHTSQVKIPPKPSVPAFCGQAAS